MADAILLQKCEQAMAEYLDGLAIADNIYQGKSQDDKAAPCVICVAESAGEDDPPATGNKWIDCSVVVKYLAPQQDAEDNVTDSNTLSGEIFDAIQTDTLQDDLTNDEITVMGVIFGAVEAGQEGDCFVDTMKLRLYACPKAFA